MRAVAMVDAGSEAMQRLTDILEKESGAQCDWNYLAGRGIVKTSEPQVLPVSLKLIEILETRAPEGVHSAVVYIGGVARKTHSWRRDLL